MELPKSNQSTASQSSGNNLTAGNLIQQLKAAANERYGSVEAVVRTLSDENLDGDEFERIWATAFCQYYDRQSRIKIVEAGLPFARKYNRWPAYEELNSRLLEQGQRFDHITMREFAGIVGSISVKDEFSYWLCLDARSYGNVDSQFASEIKGNVARVRELLTVGSAPESVSARRTDTDRIEMKLRDEVGTPSIAKIKWQWTDRAFVLFCKLQCEEGAVPYKHEGSTTRNEIPWESFCALYVRKNGIPFNPEQLASEASKVGDSKNDPKKKMRYRDEVERMSKSVSTENNTPRSARHADAVTGSLSDTSVVMSAPGRVGPERR